MTPKERAERLIPLNDFLKRDDLRSRIEHEIREAVRVERSRCAETCMEIARMKDSRDAGECASAIRYHEDE